MTDPRPARRALVTGGHRGIGRELTLGLAAAGVDVALLGRNPDAMDEVAESARAHGVRVATAAADVTDPDATRDAVTQIDDELGGTDLLVNNAGRIESVEADLLSTDLAETWQIVETNLYGPMLLAHAILPGMLERDGGRVVTINTGSAHKATPVYTGYAVSKGAAARLTTELSIQFHDHGLRAFDLSPGVVPTDMTASMPMHDNRTEWTPVQAIVDLLLGIARGELDALSGRFLRAGADTVASLQARTEQILATDARTLRLSTWGDDDPVT